MTFITPTKLEDLEMKIEILYSEKEMNLSNFKDGDSRKWSGGRYEDDWKSIGEINNYYGPKIEQLERLRKYELDKAAFTKINSGLNINANNLNFQNNGFLGNSKNSKITSKTSSNDTSKKKLFSMDNPLIYIIVILTLTLLVWFLNLN